MRRMMLFLPIGCLLATDGVSATASAAQPPIDCSSPIPPKTDFKTHIDTCRAQAAAARSRAGVARAAGIAAADVFSNRTTVAGAVAKFANVPTWSDADILAQFPLQRDNRYMTVNGFNRRISWQYPDNGCSARAEQFDVKVAEAGKTRPWKLFAFGRSPYLRVYTSNEATGKVGWFFHVAPVVKNSAGEPIVFDAALSPCKPLPWKTWLALMVDDMALYDNIDGYNGVGLGDSWAYDYNSLVTGEPSHSVESLNSMVGEFLPLEWDRQASLGRDPNVVLGNSPPWSGFGCLTADIEQTFTTVGANSSKTITTNCPFATLAVGGGYGIDPTGINVSKTARSGNGWQVVFKNNTGSTKNVVVSANCLTGAPANASVTTVSNTVSAVQPGSSATASAACASGTLIGGGYSTTQGSTSVMRVYKNGRSSSSGSSWQTSVNNTTFSAKDVTAYGYCLANTSFTFNRTSAAIDSGGVAFTTCSPKKVLGGGHSFPSGSNYTVTQMFPFGSEIFITNMSPAPANGDPSALGYAECVAHP